MTLPFNASRVREFALATACAGTAFWICTFYAINRVPLGDGTGFQSAGSLPAWNDICRLLPSRVVARWPAAESGSPSWNGGTHAFDVVWLQLPPEFPKK